MKPAVLFLVILIPFFGCGKKEKKIPNPTQVHEINIGTGLSFRNIDGKSEYGFNQFWKFDLLNDSFYIKRNQTFIDSPGYIQVWAGQYDYTKDSLAILLIQEALHTQNGKVFLSDTALSGVVLDGPQRHFIQYRRDTLTKYFIYQVGPGNFGPFISRLSIFGRDEVKDTISQKTDLKDDSLAQYIGENNKLNAIMEPMPPAVKKTIKFTPPQIKN